MYIYIADVCIVTFVFDDLYHNIMLVAGATVDITVHIEQASEVSVPTSSTSAASYKAQASQPSPSKGSTHQYSIRVQGYCHTPSQQSFGKEKLNSVV